MFSNPKYALGFRRESLKCKENGSSTVLLKRRRGYHHGEHQKSWTFPLSKQFELVIDILMHNAGKGLPPKGKLSCCVFELLSY